MHKSLSYVSRYFEILKPSPRCFIKMNVQNNTRTWDCAVLFEMYLFTYSPVIQPTHCISTACVTSHISCLYVYRCFLHFRWQQTLKYNSAVGFTSSVPTVPVRLLDQSAVTGAWTDLPEEVLWFICLISEVMMPEIFSLRMARLDAAPD